MSDWTYRGDRFGMVRATREDGLVEPLPAWLEVANHSPTGFAWGYGGSGSAQLALAILCHYFERAVGHPRDVAREMSLPLYQAFKWRTVAAFEECWSLTTEEVAEALRAIAREAGR